MAYRAGFYALILAVALLGAFGFGLLRQAPKHAGPAQGAAVAAPLAADNSGGDNSGGDNSGGDNSGDNSGGDNSSDNSGGDNSSDNSGGDNSGGDNSGGDNSGGDNSSSSSSKKTPTPIATATSAPAAVRTPGAGRAGQAAPAGPAAPSAPTTGGPCQFVRGFADLNRILNGRNGNCLTDEFPDPNGTGDTLQLTSLPAPNGLMVWNKATNSMRWTDGSKTWAYSKCLLQERLNTEVFAWELNPNLLIPESAPVPPGACDVLPRVSGELPEIDGQ